MQQRVCLGRSFIRSPRRQSRAVTAACRCLPNLTPVGRARILVYVRSGPNSYHELHPEFKTTQQRELPVPTRGGRLFRSDTEHLRRLGQDGSLFIDRAGELGWTARIRYLGGHDQAVFDDRVSVQHSFNIGGDALTQTHRHDGRAKQPNEPIHCQCRVAGLSDRRSVRYRRCAHRICDGEQFDLPGLNLRAGDRVGRLVNLHAPSRQIVNRLNWIAVWDLFYVDADALKPTLEHDVEGTGQAGPVKLSGLGARQFDHVPEGLDGQVDRHRNSDDGIGYSRYWGEIARLVRQIVMLVGVADE